MTHVRHFQQQRNVWSIATGNLLNLSEQQLVNCSLSIPLVTAISRTMDLFSPMEVSRVQRRTHRQRADQALDSVDVAEACGRHANLKPRFTDAPWKMALFTQAITQTSLAKYMEVPKSWSARVDEMREMAGTIKTEVLTDLNVTRKRLHQIASDFVGCNTLTIQVSTCRSTFRAEVKSHTSCRKQRHAEDDVSMACAKF